MQYWSKIDIFCNNKRQFCQTRVKYVNIDPFQGFCNVIMIQNREIQNIMNITIEFLLLEKLAWLKFDNFEKFSEQSYFFPVWIYFSSFEIFKDICDVMTGKYCGKHQKPEHVNQMFCPWSTPHTDFCDSCCFGIIKSNIVVKGSYIPVSQTFFRFFVTSFLLELKNNKKWTSALNWSYAKYFFGAVFFDMLETS